MRILSYSNWRSTLLLTLCVLIGLSGCAKASVFKNTDTATRQNILITAKRMLGTRYVFGGTSTRGIDCSGLVQYAYREAGIKVPRTAQQQFQASQPRRKVLPGDLLFFRTGKTQRVNHVGIYIGNGQMIHASSGSKRVRKARLSKRYWRKRLVGGGTFLGTNQATIVLAKP